MKCLVFLLLVQLGLARVIASDYSDSVLTNLKGVGLEVRPFTIQSDLFKLAYDEVESHAISSLESLNIRMLSSVELEVMPGQPFLEISIDVAHAQGPSHLYVVRLELREMAKLERPKDKVVSMALATWERKVMGIANRPEKITEEMDRLLRMFADEFHTANRPEEPRK